MKSRPVFILDSSPLITLALFPVHKPAIEDILLIADVEIAATVAIETTGNITHRDAKIIKRLLDVNRIVHYPVPITPDDVLIRSYSRIDDGEADTIQLALTRPNSRLVLDDEAAFVVACHFGLSPIMLLDLLAESAKLGLLDTKTTLRIVAAVASRYSEAFVAHTRHKLGEK